MNQNQTQTQTPSTTPSAPVLNGQNPAPQQLATEIDLGELLRNFGKVAAANEQMAKATVELTEQLKAAKTVSDERWNALSGGFTTQLAGLTTERDTARTELEALKASNTAIKPYDTNTELSREEASKLTNVLGISTVRGIMDGIEKSKTSDEAAEALAKGLDASLSAAHTYKKFEGKPADHWVVKKSTAYWAAGGTAGVFVLATVGAYMLGNSNGHEQGVSDTLASGMSGSVSYSPRRVA